jgi:hypothetical protein
LSQAALELGQKVLANNSNNFNAEAFFDFSLFSSQIRLVRESQAGNGYENLGGNYEEFYFNRLFCNY